MLQLIAFIMFVTVAFFLLSRSFENGLRNKKFKALSSFPLVSIMIPAYKSESMIKETLDAVKKSDYPRKEVIVVNDSDDGTPKICRRYGCKVIQNKERRGKGHALNMAAKKAKGEFFLFLDSDTTMQKSTIRTLMKSFKGYESEGEKIGIVAPRYEARNKNKTLAKFSDMEQAMHQNLLKIQMNFKSILSTRGCCLLVKKQAFLDSGGFASTILEDGDFNAKVIGAGYRIKYEPRALVKTREPETYKSLFRAKQRYGKGTLFCLLNHKGTYMASLQSAVCFYPMLLLLIAFASVFVFQDPLTLALTLALSTPVLYGFSATALITSAALIAVAGALMGVNAPAAAQKSGLLGTVLPFVVIFIPIIAAAYMKGFFSGALDRIKGRPELDFSNW